MDGKSWMWSCQGWVGWTFKNVLYLMVGASEKRSQNDKELHEDCW